MVKVTTQGIYLAVGWGESAVNWAFLEKIPTYGLLLCVVFSIALLLDRKIKPALKKRLANRLFGTSSATIEDVSVYYDVTRHIFGHTFGIFILRSALTTTATLTVLILIQSLFDSRDFDRTTFPFLQSVITLKTPAIFVLLGVFIIDQISIYQTITFLRIARTCKNFFEIFFIGFADFLLSITIFILIFPFFVTVAFLQINKSVTYDVALSGTPTAQGSFSTSDLLDLLVFHPPGTLYEKRSATKETEERHWFLRLYPVYTYEHEGQSPTLKDALANGSRIGSVLVQTKGLVSDVELFGVLKNLLEKQPGIAAVKMLDSNDGMFGSSALLSVIARPRVQYRYFWRTYSAMLKQINFLDEQFVRVVTLRSSTISQNTVLYSYAMASSLPTLLDERRDAYIFCDGKIDTVERSQALQIASKYDKCEKGITVDSLALKNFVHFGIYVPDRDIIPVPISPLALSSLTATFVIYYLLLSKFVFQYLGRIFVTLADQGEAALRRHLFFVTSILIMTVALPLSLLAQIVFR
jgi:hypothetical protein